MILTDKNNQIIDTLFRKKDLLEIAGEFYNPDFSLLKKSNINAREVRPFTSDSDFNSFIDEHYSQKNSTVDFDRIKEKKIKNLDGKISRIYFHLSKLENRQKHFSKWQSYRETGEIIRANLYKIKKGDLFLRTENYFNDNKLIEIELQQELSPLENSERYFKKYKKSREGLRIVENEILSVKENLNTVKLLREKVLLTVSPEELQKLTGGEKKKALPGDKNKIGLEFQSRGYTILVGRNSKENDRILRKKVRGNDMWLHVRDFPGGFVMIKTIKGKSVPLDVLLDGANLALLYSSKKYKDKADIHYTEVKNLRRVKGGKEGLVLANNEKNLFITYDGSRIKRLQHKNHLLETKLSKNDN